MNDRAQDVLHSLLALVQDTDGNVWDSRAWRPDGPADDVMPGVAEHHMLRVAEQPLVGLAVVTGIPDEVSTPGEIAKVHRWAANAAYNRHAPFVLVVSAREATLLLTRRYRREERRPLDWGVDGGVVGHEAADTFPVESALRGHTSAQRLAGWLRVDRLTDLRALGDSERLAQRQGYVARASVDEVLLDHLFAFRARVLRADEYEMLSASERAHFDTSLVVLMTRLLFVRRLEDHSYDGRKRGDLLRLLMDGAGDGSALMEHFAQLHRHFNSELFPAAAPAAYRMPAVTLRDLRDLIQGLYSSPAHGVVYDFRALECDSLGLLYQEFAGVRWPADRTPVAQLRLLGKDGLVPEAVRRRLGVFYTPTSLVDSALRLSLGRWMSEAHERQPAAAAPAHAVPRILDLAAGSGVFLVRAFAMARRFAQAATEERPDWSGTLDAWIAALHGCDIDARAIALARLNLWMEYARDRADARLPSLAATIRVADSLRNTDEFIRNDLAAAEAVETVPGFPEEWEAQGFDIIVGNPPFLSHREAIAHFGLEAVGRWRQRFRSVAKEVNLAALFAERALGLLRPGGYLALVLPRNLIKTESGEMFRRVLRTTCEVVEIIDFLDGEVFQDAEQAAVLLVARRPAHSGDRRGGATATVIGGPNDSAGRRSVHRRMLAALQAETRSADWVRQDLDLDDEVRLLAGAGGPGGGDPPWLLEGRVGRQVLQRLTDAPRRLADCVETYYGVDEGARGVFVLSDIERVDASHVSGWSVAVDQRVTVEARWVRSAADARDLGVLGRSRSESGGAEQANTLSRLGIVYPYDPDTGEVVPWAALRTEAPALAAHLDAVRVRLLERRGHGASDGWWVPRAVRPGAPWHRRATWDRPLLVMRRHGILPQVTLMPARTVPTGNVFVWALRESAALAPEVLVALLSSTVWWWLVQVSGTVGTGRLYRLTPALMRHVGIPRTFDTGHEISTAVTAVIQRALVAAELTLPALWDQVDDLVCDAYALTTAERRHIRAMSRVYGTPRSRHSAVVRALGAADRSFAGGTDDVDSGEAGTSEVLLREEKASRRSLGSLRGGSSGSER